MRKKLHFNRAVKRGISVLTTLTLFSGSLPLSEIFKELDVFRNALTAHGIDDYSQDPTLYSAQNIIDYSLAYRAYPQNHYKDNITISRSEGLATDLFTNFKGLGTPEYPFAGTITINSTDTHEMNLDTAFFDYVYDYVTVDGGIDPANDQELHIIIKPSADSKDAVFANHVLHDDGTLTNVTYGTAEEGQTHVSPASWVIEIGDYENGGYKHGSLIGEMGEDAKASVEFINDYSAEIESDAQNGRDGNAGAVCGTMKEGSELTVKSISGVDMAKITASGHAGGIVGEMKNGSKLTISGTSYVSPTAFVTAGNDKYAGGIAGCNDGAVVELTDGYTCIKNKVSGGAGAGGVCGYYKPIMENNAYSLDLDSISVGENANNRCSVSSSGGAGGFFGVLDNSGGTIEISGNSEIFVKGSGDHTVFGGIIGKYRAASLSDTLSVSGTSSVKLNVNADKSGNLTYYGGVIGKIDDACFAEISDIEVKAYSAADEFFGGAVACADNGYVYVKNLKLTASAYRGGAAVGHTSDGVVHLAGSLDIGNAGSDTGVNYGQIVGFRDSALVFAESGWNLTRGSAAAADDIGSWGEVVRFKETDYTIDSVLDSYYVPSAATPVHYAVLKGAVISNNKIQLSDKSAFARAALNMQLNGGVDSEVLKFSDKTNSRYYALKSKNIEMTADIDLHHTGMTGLTRDSAAGSDGIGQIYAGTEFSGGGYKLTLAIGEGYEGTDNAAADPSGKGKIYNHRFNGLFGETSSGLTVKDLRISGCVYTGSRAEGSTVYVGTVAGNAGAALNVSAVTVDSDTRITYATVRDEDTLYVGGLAGKMGTSATSKIGSQSGYTGTNNSTFGAKISGSAGRGTLYVGGVAGYLGADCKVYVYDIKLTNEVSNSAARDTQKIGGLFGAVADGTNTLDLNGVNAEGLTVRGKMNSGGSVGGILGYSWDGVTATFDHIKVGAHTSSASSDCTLGNESSSGNMAGLVYTGSGYWKFSGVEIDGLTLTGSSSESFGMLVNKAYSNNKAMYIELPSGYTYKINNVSGSAVTASSIYDEIAVYSRIDDKTIEENGNSVISINTNGTTRYGSKSDTKVNMSSGSCNTYQNQVTSSGFNKYNPNSRYYYNLDNYRNSPSAGAQSLFIYSVNKYAHSSISGYFSASGSTFSGNLDMDGYSYYPFDVSETVNISGNAVLHNQEIETRESESGGDSFARTTLNTPYQTQHYLMHAGLLRNVGGKVYINGVLSISGTVPKVGNYCGAIICGSIGGSAQADAVVSSERTGASIALNGIKVYNKDASYSPLLINYASGYVVMDIYNVSASGYQSNEKIATSLIGAVGSDTAEKVQVTFDNIKLDARTSENVLASLTSVYGTKSSLFTKAALLDSLTYSSGSGSFGVYNYEYSEDWGGSGSRSVTYGIEISADSSVNKGKEYYYYKNFGNAAYFTNPSQDSTSAGLTAPYDFSGFLPYVAEWGERIKNSSTKHQLDVNHSAATFGGCGTYNHPFTIAASDSDKSGGLVTIARIISKIQLPDNTFTIELPDDITTPSKWCNSQTACAEYTFNGTDTFVHPTDTSKNKSLDNVRKYLAGAYYYFSTDIEIESNSGFTGLGNTDNDFAVFRGVIAGNGKIITNKTNAPLIYASNGSVIKKLTVVVKNSGQIVRNATSSQTFASTGGCAAYGAVIGRVFGGDNIIDQVSVDVSAAKLSSASTGDYLTPVGGYIGVIVDGGVFFRNMDDSHVSADNRKGFTDSGNFADNDTGHLYCNPIIGRVLNGYAVTEGSTYAPTDDTATMKNGTKNYAIADIVKNDKLTVGTTMNIGSAQQWFVLSLIVNDGSALYLGTNKAVHRGTYGDVGVDADTPTADDANDKIGTSGLPYIFREYANGTWTSNSTGYTVNLAENGEFRLPDGYRGIGGINSSNSSHYIKIAGLNGNNAQITLNMKYQSYHVDSSGTKYDNYTPGDYGFGLFTLFVPSANNISVSNFSISGSVMTEVYTNAGGETYNYGGSYGSNNSTITEVANRGRLHSGMFAGLKSDTGKKLIINNVSLSVATVESDRRAGGLIGSAANVTLNQCSADAIKVIGRGDTGGLLGCASNGVSILGDDSIVNGETKKTTVAIDVINQKAKGTKYQGSNNNRSTAVGGLVGDSAGALTIQNIIIQKATGKDGIIMYTNIDDNDDLAAVGGFVGGVSAGGSFTITRCTFGNVSVRGNSARIGGIVGSANGSPTIIISNIEMNGLEGSTKNSIEGNSKDSLGGIIGFAEASLTIEDISIKNYKITKNRTDRNDTTSNYIGGCVGVLYNTGKTLYLRNFSIIDCEFTGKAYGSETNEGAGRVGGIVGRIWGDSYVYGYNVALKNISINELNNPKKYLGDIIGYGSGKKVQIVGFSRQNTPTDKLINNEATYTQSNTYYVIFADYNGTGIDGSGNQSLPKMNGTEITGMVADINTKSPYVAMNPSIPLDDNNLFVSDGINKVAVEQIISDINGGSSKKRYQLTSADGINISTFDDELGDIIPNKSYKDMPVLIVNSSDGAENAVNNYLRMLTNSSTFDFSYSNKYMNGSSSIGTVSIKKCTYITNTDKFTIEDDPCLQIDSNGKFTIKKVNGVEQYDTAVAAGQFTLIDVAFKDPSDNTKVAYHLYVPVIVKKLLEYEFDISAISGSTYDQTLYSNRGNNIVENLGSPITLEFEYNYLRNATEWAAESDTAYKLDKYLSFNPQTTALFDDKTKLILVDINRGGTEYYLDKWSDGYDSTKKQLNLQAFKDASGTAFSPPKFSEMIAEQGITGEQTLKEKYYLTIFTDPFVRPKLRDENDKPILDENGEEIVDTDLVKVIHYEVTSPNIENTEHPTRRVNCSDQAEGSYHYVSHLVMGDFFENDLTVTTPENANEQMSSSNKTITVEISAPIGIVNAGTHEILIKYLGKKNVTIYQSILVSFEKYREGIKYDTGITAIDGYSILSYTMNDKNGNPIPITEQSVNRNINFIEFKNNKDISNSLQSGKITVSLKAVLEFKSDVTRKAQFPYKSGDEVTGALVKGYSNISSSPSNTAYSTVTKSELDKNQKYYYCKTEESADLRYYADYSGADKQNQLDQQLGINAREIEESQTSSFVQTEGRYDASGLVKKDDAKYIKCTVRLYQKQKNDRYAEVKVSDYLTQLNVNAEKNIFYSDPDTNTYIYKIADVEEFQNEQNVYKIPITFDVITGNKTSFKDSSLYSNYKVELAVSLFDHDAGQDTVPWTEHMRGSAALDFVIYTNARIYTDLIKN